MSDVSEASSEGYAQEIQKRVPLRLAAGFVLTVLLYWGSTFGVYESGLLGILNLSGDWFIKNNSKLLELPLYVYVVAALLNIWLHAIIQTLSRKYFRYVTSLPAISNRIKKLFDKSLDTKINEATVDALLAEIEYARYKTRKKADIAHMLLLASGSFFVATFLGNFLDFSVGILLLCSGIYFLYRSVGIFIAELVPKRAHLRSIYSAEEPKLRINI